MDNTINTAFHSITGALEGPSVAGYPHGHNTSTMRAPPVSDESNDKEECPWG